MAKDLFQWLPAFRGREKPLKTMDYKETFEDEGFVYELTVKPAEEVPYPHDHLRDGYSCAWSITKKESHLTRQLLVTDDFCEVIVYQSLEAAVKGAREFLSI